MKMGIEDPEQPKKSEVSPQEQKDSPETEKCVCGECFAMPADIVEYLHCDMSRVDQCFDCYEKQMGTQRLDQEKTYLLHAYCDTGKPFYLDRLREIISKSKEQVE